MISKECIIYKVDNHQLCKLILKQSTRYALISVAFTYNRMDKKNLITRISNIIKGKVAEGIFRNYCLENQLNVDFDSCYTPFWMPDKRDFLWLGGEWDLKNNFIYCSDKELKYLDFSMLPALIPNNNETDQWNRRNETYHTSSRFSAYIFSFMRLLPTQRSFFNLDISEAQIEFLSSVSTQYKKFYISEMPFKESWFFDQFYKLGPEDISEIHYWPEFIITSCANVRYWPLFEDTSFSDDDHYINFSTDQQWYQKTNGILRFNHGGLVTKIKNKTCPVGLLPSFQSVIDSFKT